MKAKSNDKAPADELILAQQIADRELLNSVFHTLDPAAKRVAVAHDVLIQLEAGKIMAAFDGYVKTREYDADERAIELPVCKVCAIGSVFMSSFLDQDEVLAASTVNSLDYLPSRKMVEALAGLGFDERQLRMMETAYEGQWIQGTADYNVNACVEYCANVSSPHDRLIKIMQNVVDNNGDFIP